MDLIDELFDKAESLFEKAEESASGNLSEAVLLFRQGIENLYRAFILFNDAEPRGGLDELFKQCLSLEPEFEVIDTEQGYFAAGDASLSDEETMIDAANEIWDFVYGLLEEGEEE
jgi:hypothetical protein